jgi:hypothetical protein
VEVFYFTESRIAIESLEETIGLSITAALIPGPFTAFFKESLKDGLNSEREMTITAAASKAYFIQVLAFAYLERKVQL